MIIRKKFNVESAHIVRNCTSERCSHSIHGHSATIELFFESRKLDNAQMVMDFGLMKSAIKQFIDSMDHCYLLCSKEKREFRNFIKSECDRYIEFPFNPSAEMLATYVLAGVNYIISHMQFNNGEQDVQCVSCRYHETASGWSQADLMDAQNFLPNLEWTDIEFSHGVRKDWSEELTKCIDGGADIVNPTIPTQIEL